MARTGTELMAEPGTDAAETATSSAAAVVRTPGAARSLTAPPVESRGGWWGVANAVCVPVAAGLALWLHYKVPDQGPVVRTSAYAGVLTAILAAGVLAVGLRWASPAARAWLSERSPLFAGGLLLLCAWDLTTAKLVLLPSMYFPGPQRVLQTLVDDRGELLKSTGASLLLLFSGYGLGVVAGLVSGVMIGWSGGVRYWGMPVLKVLGPIPATAWIPMALIFFPRSMAAGVFLIALAVWFPVTMLSASGVSNVRASYLDVARTLGAGRAFLIFRVAIPAAMPSIFVGLFMGLGASFLTLLVAESTGVSAGLGWYIDWARNYSDYTKVFAALIIMAAFFSTIMTLLFKVRDQVLVWQKGTIKW
jgi:NitT/TauT family transport system permease protein